MGLVFLRLIPRSHCRDRHGREGAECRTGENCLTGGVSMPISTKIDLEADFTEHIATGELRDDEMFAAQKDFYENGPTRLQLWNMSGCVVTGVTIGGMRTFIESAARHGKVRQSGKTAVIVSSQLQYGLARMAEAFGEFANIPFAFRVFKDREDAVDWLNEE